MTWFSIPCPKVQGNPAPLSALGHNKHQLPCYLGFLDPSLGRPRGLWAYRHPPAGDGVRIPGPPPSSSHTEKLKSERTKRW